MCAPTCFSEMNPPCYSRSECVGGFASIVIFILADGIRKGKCSHAWLHDNASVRVSRVEKLAHFLPSVSVHKRTVVNTASHLTRYLCKGYVMLLSITECMYNPFKNKRYVGLGVPVATQGISMLSPTLNGITPDASYTISGGTEISKTILCLRV